MINEYLKYIQEDSIPKIVWGTTKLAVRMLLGLEKDKEREYIKNKCKKYKGKYFKKCKYTTLIGMREKFLASFPKYRAACKKQKNPQKCLNYLDKKELIIKRKNQEMLFKIKNM